MANKDTDTGKNQTVDQMEEVTTPEERASTQGNSDIEALELQNSELQNKYLRLVAEFDNHKKRNIRERMDLIKNASSETITSLLPVLDDFERARLAAEEKSSSETPFSEGVQLVYHKLHNILQQKGLSPMKVMGEPFDPETMEALAEVPANSPDQSGRVVDVIEQGYYLNDRILRHAKVVVGK